MKQIICYSCGKHFYAKSALYKYCSECKSLVTVGCSCGCGSLILRQKRISKGYVKGHSWKNRLLPEEVCRKISETRIKRKVAVGIRNPMYGRTKEKDIERALKIHITRQRIPKEIRSQSAKKQWVTKRNKYTKEEISVQQRKGWLVAMERNHGKLWNRSISKIEDKLYNELADFGFEIERQKLLSLSPFEERHVSVDIFIFPKVCIFCDGNYWHGNDLAVQRDNLTNMILKKKGYTVLRFWESHINNDLKGCVDTILRTLIRRDRRGTFTRDKKIMPSGFYLRTPENTKNNIGCHVMNP